MDKYLPKEIEEKNYSFWTENNYFKADENSPLPPFSIVIPPPNVTGSLHMGHALNNTLQDILSRYKRAQGFNVLWVPGCDHAGIATQNVVERELKKEGKKKEDLGREGFLKRVWEWKEQYGATIMMQLRRLGSSCDWSRERFTMDEGLSNAVKEVFIRLYNEGLIYRGDYIVNWCPRCLTAISDIEVIHQELEGHFYHIRYPYADGSGNFIEVATTRPETMLGDTAVAVNPEDPRYAAVKEGTLVTLPETGRTIPIIKDNYVDKDFGTGAVKITPAHDPNDFEVGARHKLPIINVMNENGTMNKNAGVDGKYNGLERFVARKKLVDTLKEQGFLVKVDAHRHAVGHCYRCNTIVEPYVSAQWFVKIKPMAEKAIEVVEQERVKFVPEMWKKVYFEWMNNIKDWCISRQLWWGHRIPAWYCKQGHITVAKDAPGKCSTCGSTELRQDNDVLDTWFSSALWPFSTLGWPEKTKDLEVYYPTTVLVTSWDILFFWVARMIMSGMKFMGKEPFSTVVINSLVCDEEGKKMSKSKGNVIDPLLLINNYSADALRFTMTALETQSRHISFSEERLKGNANFMNKVWNASKFTISNIQGVETIDLASCRELRVQEKWILKELNSLNEKVTECMEKYKFADMAQLMYEFFWHSFCDWYIEISKLDMMDPASPHRNMVKNVLLKILKDSLVIMHPVIPFITEEIYQNLPPNARGKSIMKEKWPEIWKDYNPDLSEMKLLQEVIYHIRNTRGELAVSPAQKADIYLTIKDAEKEAVIKKYEVIIKNLAKAAVIEYKQPQETVASKEIEGFGVIGMAVKGAVDVVKEKENLKKKVENFENLIKNIETRLANPGFTSKAPKKVIDEEKAKIEKYKEDIKKANDMLETLNKVK